MAIAGATTLYRLEWVLVFLVPMFATMQSIGTLVAGHARLNVQGLVRRRYGRTVALLSLAALVSVNVLTLAADLEAGDASLALITGAAAQYWSVPLVVAVAALLTFGSFDRVRVVLAVLPVAFLAYVVAAFLAHPSWPAVLGGLVPSFSLTRGFLVTLVAIVGTVMTAYGFEWQTVEVAKDNPPIRRLAGTSLSSLPGIVATLGVLWFIVVATGATLGVHHHAVRTAQDAAKALAPFAGRYAPDVFGLGLLGSSLLALPVIAATTANAIRVTFAWKGTLDDPPRKAKAQYAAIYACLALAAAFSFAGVPAMALLFAASIAAGIATPVYLVLMMLLAHDTIALRGHALPFWLLAGGWIVTVAIAIAALSSVATMIA